MAASPPPTNGPPISAVTHSIQPGGAEITPRDLEISKLGMSDLTGGEGSSADIRSIPLTETKAAPDNLEIESTEKAASSEDGNSSAANCKIQAETEHKGEEEADKSEEAADAVRDGKIQKEKGAGASDVNSIATNRKIQPSETKAGPRKTEDKSEKKVAGAKEGNSSPTNSNQQPRKSTRNTAHKREKKVVAGSALLVNMPLILIEGLRKLNPKHRALVILCFVYLIFVLILTVEVPILLLVRFHEQQMCQVWVISITLCSQVFFVLQCIWRDWWFFTDFTRLYFAPLLAFYVSYVIGHHTAIFILHLNTVWAAGYLGYALALHRLRKGSERAAIRLLPSHVRHIKYNAQEEISWTYFVASILLMLWTVFMAMAVYTLNVTEELSIVLTLSYVGWISVFPWVSYVANELLHGVLLKEPMTSVGYLIPIAMLSPAILYQSVILLVLIHWVILMALVGFLGYNLAVYECYLRTATQWEKRKQEKAYDFLVDDHDGSPTQIFPEGIENKTPQDGSSREVKTVPLQDDNDLEEKTETPTGSELTQDPAAESSNDDIVTITEVQSKTNFDDLKEHRLYASSTKMLTQEMSAEANESNEDLQNKNQGDRSSRGVNKFPLQDANADDVCYRNQSKTSTATESEQDLQSESHYGNNTFMEVRSTDKLTQEKSVAMNAFNKDFQNKSPEASSSSAVKGVSLPDAYDLEDGKRQTTGDSIEMAGPSENNAVEVNNVFLQYTDALDERKRQDDDVCYASKNNTSTACESKQDLEENHYDEINMFMKFPSKDERSQEKSAAADAFKDLEKMSQDASSCSEVNGVSSQDAYRLENGKMQYTGDIIEMAYAGDLKGDVLCGNNKEKFTKKTAGNQVEIHLDNPVRRRVLLKDLLASTIKEGEMIDPSITGDRDFSFRRLASKVKPGLLNRSFRRARSSFG